MSNLPTNIIIIALILSWATTLIACWRWFVWYANARRTMEALKFCAHLVQNMAEEIERLRWQARRPEPEPEPEPEGCEQTTIPGIGDTDDSDVVAKHGEGVAAC